MAHRHYPAAPPGYQYVFVASVKDPKTGVVRYARNYGKRAFRILVPIR